MKTFQTNKTDFAQSRIVDVPSATLGDGQIRLNVESFAFTANNITYAVAGDFLKYWTFFPAVNADGSDASQEWGQVPVWGFASASESNCTEVAVGERFFGYFPPSEQCILTPSKVSTSTIFDSSPHRAELAAGYNTYRRAGSANTQTDNEQSLLFPLFVTAYLIHDLLAEQRFLDAEQILVLSASSKTSIGLAYGLNADSSAPHSIGLTSPRNVNTVESLALYDTVMAYDRISELANDKKTVIVDMAGNQTLLAQLHQHLGDNMLKTLSVGATHWGDLIDASGINKERVEQFFAPSQMQVIMQRDGVAQYNANSMGYTTEFAKKTRKWLTQQTLEGLEGLQPLYPKVCAGTVDANVGLIIAM